jgi:hypothetical protein
MSGDLQMDCFASTAAQKNVTTKTWIFQGFLEKYGAKTWCFGGQFVVRCVVKVVFWMVRFGRIKMGHVVEIYFWTRVERMIRVRQKLPVGGRDFCSPTGSCFGWVRTAL